MSDAAYTQEQVEAMISAAVKAALASVPHLDNSIDTGTAAREENEMPSKVQYKITLSNGDVYYLRGNTLSEAVENMLNNMEAKKKETPLFSEYAEQWRVLYHDPKAGDRWKRETARMLRVDILPYLGDKHIGDIDVATLQRFFNNFANKAESTNNHIKYVINGIFQSAIEDGYIDKNPAQSSRLTLSTKKTERKALELDEAQDILDNMSKLTDQEQLLLAMLMYTGIRRGELLALRWKDIDLNQKMIHITHAVEFADGNHAKMKSPKSKAGVRDIPIIDALMPYLSVGNPDVYLIGGGTKPVTAHTYYGIYKRIGQKIDLHGATAHVLRHTFATLSAEFLDPKTLQTILGHAKMSMSYDRYAHPQKRLINSAGTKLADMYGVNPENPGMA